MKCTFKNTEHVQITSTYVIGQSKVTNCLHTHILALEVLFIQIRDNKPIRGFKIGDLVIKFTVYADDTIFIKEKPSLNRILKSQSKYLRNVR